MTGEVIWTIVFGIIATTIGLVTIWQNFQIVQVKIEILQRSQSRAWYRYGM
ncbi:hypothetical protein EPUS_00527 [Endocarpon pusillum Z07020]|uniref:Uncharacterized protein n=1 Tax=Endocarpon pusillum (strain Z07020 / HMAS-L-300199) TaxID=1263415 RepID=U1GHE3_ENDPU|nr:uncharacterized protein EPUS_00527 [Endocarpon pusillum Z07020]ERF71538.1 hypothetical protein EPUS_00527 [Endocarpon pusillum Z07020]